MSDSSVDELDVIAVGAHPDDVEIACGGTLALLAEQGYRVGIIDLTDGEPTPYSAGPEQRQREADAAAATLGVARRVILELPNRRLFDSFEARVALATEFRRFRPKVVIGLGHKTPMASPDHWQAMQITDAAVFYSRLTKWDEHFSNLSVHTIPCQLYYPLTFDVEQALSLPHRFTVDISKVIGKKLSAIQCYESQFGHKSDILERVKAVNAVAGMAAGFGSGELLARTRPLGTQNLMEFLGLE
ncbi:MAG: PIG-L family deacetylase [Pirellulaceae bacterium]|nr:PIG-L family deacetylase [Pirellulaceae bacterium]